jgi:hypothetical protein
MGIRNHPTAARSPWQNGRAERLIGSIRRECLDHIVVPSEPVCAGSSRLHRLLQRAPNASVLEKDSLGHRPVQRFGQRCSVDYWWTSSSILPDFSSQLSQVAGNALVNLHQSLTHLRKSVFPVSNNGLPHFFLGSITSRSFVALTLSAGSLCPIAGPDALVTARPAPAG